MSSGFISESEIADQRRTRQEEWERVRTADQPVEAPEEPYDPRSLYERLQEQKTKRDAEYEEAHKLKNMIKGLDDDEVEFLDLIDRNKLEEERKKHLEEEKEMRDFKAAVASLQEKSLDERLKQELKNPQSTIKSTSSGSGKNSQLRLLTGVVVKKSSKTDNVAQIAGTKRKHSETEEESNNGKEETCSEKVKRPLNVTKDEDSDDAEIVSDPKLVGMKCIGILPGLGCYDNSTDSDSSDSDQDLEPKKPQFDMLGRKIVNVEVETNHKEKS